MKIARWLFEKLVGRDELDIMRMGKYVFDERQQKVKNCLEVIEYQKAKLSELARECGKADERAKTLADLLQKERAITSKLLVEKEGAKNGTAKKR